jgi:hypothetical protein
MCPTRGWVRYVRVRDAARIRCSARLRQPTYGLGTTLFWVAVQAGILLDRDNDVTEKTSVTLMEPKTVRPVSAGRVCHFPLLSIIR